jgi:hypothetical protein
LHCKERAENASKKSKRSKRVKEARERKNIMQKYSVRNIDQET